MKKFLLVLFVGMVLAINVYGFVTEMIEIIEQTNRENEVATMVYME